MPLIDIAQFCRTLSEPADVLFREVVRRGYQ